MGLALVADDLFMNHRPPGPHPERPERLVAVREGLERAGVLDRARRLPSRPADRAELERVHTAGYLDEMARALPGNSGWIDSDTYFSAQSWEVALAAAGSAIDLCAAALSSRRLRGFAAVRPPGHHAEADTAMGFCLLNSAAIAAAAAREAGADRVAVLDWDVHHGNGTQHAFYGDASVLYLSAHEFPLYPGTGDPGEIGTGAGLAATVNVAMPAGAGDAEYDACMERVFAPALRRFRPEIILVSAGFDAHAADPLAGMRLSAAGFGRMAARVCEIADEVCDGRVVCVLEGGYDLDALRDSTTEVVRALAADVPAASRQQPTAAAPAAPAAVAIDATRAALARVGCSLEDR